MARSKEIYSEIISKLVSQGAECIILGCTEIPLLIKQEKFTVPLLDTATIHAQVDLTRAIRT